MAEDETSLLLLVVVAVIAVIGLALSAASFATNESMAGMMGTGGGMMQNHGTTTPAAPGGFEWAVLILSVAFLAVSLALIFRRRSGAPYSPPALPVVESTTAPGSVPAASAAPEPTESAPASPPAAMAQEPVSEPALVKLLDEDERRMYLEVRDHGGSMLQRDIVALGIFSKAKVTRVLDRLESKGVVVREAHGMTNRVRLVGRTAR